MKMWYLERQNSSDKNWSVIERFPMSTERYSTNLQPGMYRVWNPEIHTAHSMVRGPENAIYYRTQYTVCSDGSIVMQADDPWAIEPGDFIKARDTGLLGIVRHAGTIELANGIRIPGYSVKTAKGGVDFIPATDASVVSYDFDGPKGAARLLAESDRMLALMAESRNAAI
jgi:hypothetical protein